MTSWDEFTAVELIDGRMEVVIWKPGEKERVVRKD